MSALQHAQAGLWQVPAPAALRQFHPGIDDRGFHQYEEEKISTFTPKDVVAMLATEAARLKGKPVTAVDADKAQTAREALQFIPQPAKKGPDGVTPVYNSGAYLTNDALVC